MIPIVRVHLDDELAGRLNTRSDQLKTLRADTRAARAAWKSAALERHGIRAHLVQMAPGIRRCMYCGDNLGTDIDHFEPISSAPIRAFVSQQQQRYWARTSLQLLASHGSLASYARPSPSRHERTRFRLVLCQVLRDRPTSDAPAARPPARPGERPCLITPVRPARHRRRSHPDGRACRTTCACG